MTVRARVWRSFYQDSVVLMRVAAELSGLPGVREAAALMGTPANHELLAAAGLATSDIEAAAAGDLILAVDAADDATAEGALATAKRLFDERRDRRESSGRIRPRTLDSALRDLPDANLALISVPGPYAKREAQRALRRGLHVFLFSDNVSLADEVELKRLALERRLFCMGPDCGTAYLDGVGLGFANVVPRGGIGCVAASGTGLQVVVSSLAALGEGISHGLGVGGRDLSAEVGGAMTVFALEALAADSATEAIVVISKPAAPEVMPALEAAIGSIGKPVVVCCLDAKAAAGAPGTWVSTLDDAAQAVAAVARGRRWSPRLFREPARVRTRLATRGGRRPAGRLLGLFTGGTLAHEARLVLEPLVGPVAAHGDDVPGGTHRILDLGADEFTVGRPHPMLDPAGRAARVREAGRSPEVGVLLLDLVLGRAAHPDPARALSAAIRDARASAERQGRALLAIASVVGTEADPQGLRAQVAALEAAGVEVLPSTAEAARFAALALEPELAPRLLAEAP
jgi:FdrA protein